jgi:Flp pilus assembly protein TadD
VTWRARPTNSSPAKYQTILNSYPDSLYALSNIAVVRFQQGNYQEAENHLRRAIQLAPQDAFSHSILGISLYQQGKYDEAVQMLSRAVALDPNDPKTRNYLGISASQKGWQEAAEQECRKAIELDPNYGDAHFNLAVIYATQRPPALELARRHYNRAVELGIPRDQQLESMLK